MFYNKPCKRVLIYECQKLLLNVCLRKSHFKQVKQSELWTQPIGHNTGIKIYNPILKDKVDLILRNKGIATWYSCGPTVYDSAHIGHASCYVRFDIIRRILEEWFNINVITVMGITDIDDKIIKRSHEMNTDVTTIARKYEIEFFNDLKNLNVLRPSLSTRVTNYITDIISFIDKIIAEGYAYIVPSGSVYFKTTKYERYNKFGAALIEEDNAKNLDDSKHSSFDFALWKSAKPGEPYWESPWGRGRPGWHIECSAMASTVLGSNIDLHSGGVDLKFPHHENEEAQSCTHHSANQWINYWLHSGILHCAEDVKMSKSLKNTLTIGDFLKSYSANEFRILCLLSRYRYQIEYSDAAMKNASSIYKKIESFLHSCDAYIEGQLINGVVIEGVLLQELEKTRNELNVSLSDDFNTSTALASLLDLISTTNAMINEKTENIVRSPVAIAAVSNFVNEVFGKWGLDLVQSEKMLSGESSLVLNNVLNAAVEFRCSVRETIQSGVKDVPGDAKKQKRDLFKCCDEFRNNLNDLGIQLEDHGKKSSWKFKEKCKDEASVSA